MLRPLLLVISAFVLSACSGNRFAYHSTWKGTYLCRQGWTDLELKVVDLRGSKIDATFNFHHVPSGAKGSFSLAGDYDRESGIITLEPGEWIEQPSCYITVGMKGAFERRPLRFVGEITTPGCGAFTLNAVTRPCANDVCG